MCLSLDSPEREAETKPSVETVYLRMIPKCWLRDKKSEQGEKVNT